MIIRSYAPEDLEILKEIHKAHFKEEFNLPNFLKNYHCAYTVEDETGIITIGGVRPIAEAITVTNKDISVKTRREALLMVQEASKFIALRNGYNQLHCFIQNPFYYDQLQKHGFRPTRGRCLVTDI
jgi:hypothetical protein